MVGFAKVQKQCSLPTFQIVELFLRKVKINGLIKENCPSAALVRMEYEALSVMDCHQYRCAHNMH